MGLDRRGFLTLVAGGAIGTLFTPLPWKMTDNISIWTQNWPWIPRLEYGPEDALATTVKLGASEYGILINTVGGRPVTAAGNPEAPLSQGGIDPLAASSVQLLHSPARVKGPLKRTADGKFESITWDEALSQLRSKLSAIKGQKDKLACISGDETSSVNEMLAAFLSEMGSNSYFSLPSDQASITTVWKKHFQAEGRPGYDLENADHIFILGADLLESWGTVVRNQAVFGNDSKKKFIYAGPVQNNTAAVSSEWIPVQEEQLGHLALALCYQLLQMGTAPAGVTGLFEFETFLENNYSLKEAAAKAGLGEREIKRLAKSLAKAQRPLVVSGSASGLGGNSFVHMAGMALNVILGRVGQKGGVTLIADAPQVLKKTNNLAGSYTDCLSYLHQIEQGKESLPEVMFFYEANPVYALPQSGKMKEVLKEIPFKVTFSQFMDETAALCDLILPAPYFLERIDDSYAPFGVGQPTYSLTLPVVEPQANSKPTPEVVFSLAQQLSIDLGQNSFKEILKSKAQKLGADWKALNKGQTWVGKTDKTQPYLQIWSKTLAELAATAKNNGSDYPLSLTATANLKVGSKQVAIPPAGLHTLLENELQNGVFFVRINGKTARKHGLKQGMSISLQSPAGKCQARVDIFEGVMDDTVLAPLGFGHAAWDMFSRDKGDSVYKLLEVSEKGRSGLIQWADTRVKIAKI